MVDALPPSSFELGLPSWAPTVELTVYLRGVPAAVMTELACLDTPARALYRSLGFRELGRGPLGWHDAERVVLGAHLAAG